METREIQVYELIESKASSNIALQGLTGALGFPFTAIGDVAAFFTHYGPMLNQIRVLYGRKPVPKESMMTILDGCKSELLADIVIDKVLGNLPVLGLPANMICAKAMTWRLGILFGMLAARGEEIDAENVKSAVQLIREMFPQRDSLLFKKPSISVTEKLLRSVEDTTVEAFESKMERILNALNA